MRNQNLSSLNCISFSNAIIAAVLTFGAITLPTKAVAQTAEDANQSPAPVVAISTARTATEAAVENLSFGGALEILAPIPLQNGEPSSDRGRIRSFELTGQTRIDSSLRNLAAKITVGGFDDTGTMNVSLREGFVQADLLNSSNSNRSLSVRAGKYFLPIGLYNQTRHSAWATPSAPEVVTRFFGNDGIVDTGVDLQWSAASLFRLRAGVMNGYTFDAGETGAGLKPQTPTHYARPTFDFKISDAREMTVSLNYVGRIDDTGTTNRISGLDFTLLPREPSAKSWFLFGEALYRENKPAALSTSRELGGTLYFEKGLNQTWAAGVRADAFTIRSLQDANGGKRSNLNWALVPVATYKFSEAVRLQGAYTYFKETRAGDSGRTEQMIELRLVTELGSISKVRGLPGDRSSL